MGTETFREAVRADAGALGALHVASWRETYDGMIPDAVLAALSVDAKTTMWKQILDNPAAFDCAAVILAEERGKTVGFASCGPQRDRALADAGFSGAFGAIYVLRSHQRQGIGRSLMATMSEVLLRSGHTGASLWVLRENTPARAFYTRLGGIVAGEKTDARPEATLTEDAYAWRDLSLFW